MLIKEHDNVFAWQARVMWVVQDAFNSTDPVRTYSVWVELNDEAIKEIGFRLVITKDKTNLFTDCRTKEMPKLKVTAGQYWATDTRRGEVTSFLILRSIKEAIHKSSLLLRYNTEIDEKIHAKIVDPLIRLERDLFMSRPARFN